MARHHLENLHLKGLAQPSHSLFSPLISKEDKRKLRLIDIKRKRESNRYGTSKVYPVAFHVASLFFLVSIAFMSS